MSEPIIEQFGSVLRKLRLNANMTQEDLASESGITTTYIGMVERAETNITLVAAGKIADALNVKLSSMISEMGF
jgi:transcriptional regulator with XRE-family HTH domain